MSSRRCNVGVAVTVGLVHMGGLLVVVAAVPPASRPSGTRAVDAVAVMLLLAGPAALLWLTVRPQLPLAVSAVALVGYLGRDYPLGPVFVAFVVSLVVCVLTGRRVAAGLAVAGLEVAVALALVVGEIDGGQAAGGSAWLIAVVAVAEVARTRRAAAGQARATAELEQARLRGQARLLVARELHDVLAHSASLIAVQAGVALHLFDSRPEQARAALVAIKQANGDSLRDLRRTLDVLRDQPSHTPAPDLGELDRLLAGFRAAGLEVSLAVQGEPRSLPAPVGLAAYRVAQEALTNTSRHCLTPRARLHLVYGATRLEVQVDDDGPAGAGAGVAGLGLTGMRERAALLGGTITTGTRPGGGFSVRAVLPT